MRLSWHSEHPEDDNGYGRLIEQHLRVELAQFTLNVHDRTDAIVSEFIGTKQTRVGPRPNAESEVLIRQVVHHATAYGIAIPVLVPAAAVKLPLGQSLDLAELCALRQLNDLNERVKRLYPPGMNFRIRLEDLTEYVISGDTPEVAAFVETYVEQFKKLVTVLGYDSFITLVPESSLTDRTQFLTDTASAIPFIKAYLDETDSLPLAQHHALLRYRYLETTYGLKSPISHEMRDYFRQRYEKLYVGTSSEQFNHLMARYYAAVLVRRQHGAVGADTTVLDSIGITPSRLEVYFGVLLPDAPRVTTRVLYRTVPYSESSRHKPFWNAKGHFRIAEDGTTRIALGDWDADYICGQLALGTDLDADEPTTALVRADYTLE